MKNKLDQTEFLAKKKHLEQVQRTLKTEFVGLSSVIDEIIANVSSWYCLPDLQDKPAIINLWGLTGTGKTSLVNRLVQLLDYSDKYYSFDLGHKEGKSSFNSVIHDTIDHDEDEAIIFSLDEFQHARTLIGPLREEVKTDKQRKIWELLDSGTIKYWSFGYGSYQFSTLIKKLSFLLRSNVEVANGVVVKGVDLYKKEMEVKEDGEILFVPRTEYDTIIDNSEFILDQDLETFLKKKNGFEIMDFLGKVYNSITKMKEKSYTKSLIFVLGNIDEAYTMSGNDSPDMDADDFHEESRKITIPDMKKALKNRFREEQIARLGNIHIIYPALSRKSYTSIIKMELQKIGHRFKEKVGIDLKFEFSIVEFIYAEGVYPSQGVRPLFTSIHQIIKSNLSFFVSELYSNKTQDIDSLTLSYSDSNLKADFYYKESIVFASQKEVKSQIGELRNSKRDDKQAIVAVHESGHAIAHAMLLGEVPEAILSRTASAGSAGFVRFKKDKKYVSRNEVLPQVATFLAGMVAEELVFGKEYLTNGSTADINIATGFLMNLYKRSGFGNDPILYTNTTEHVINAFHEIADIENEVRSIIQEAKKLAMNTLRNEMHLLLKISDILSDRTILKKEEIENLFDQYSTRNYRVHKKENYYRNKLKILVQELSETKIYKPSSSIEVLNSSVQSSSVEV